jgi:Delta3-Delta2-enoyl-CoA isomerase
VALIVLLGTREFLPATGILAADPDTGARLLPLSTMQTVELPSNTESLVTVSKPHEYVWCIELHNGVDNRLTHALCDALSQALNLVEAQWRDKWRPTFHDKNDTKKVKASGALILIANRKQQKFFSNGFDIPTLMREPNFVPSRHITSH